MSYPRLVSMTALALIAFAANSLLCRAALADGSIDAASFTSIRLIAGAAVLWLIVRLRAGNAVGKGNWLSALALFAYAAGFSFAYIELSTATGALLLFGAVFAINSSLHSYLIVSLARADGVSLDVGFYYMANAAGRLLGTVLSGGLFLVGGMQACLWASALLVGAAWLVSGRLPPPLRRSAT